MVNHTQGLAGTIAKTGICQDGQASEGRRMKTFLEEAAAAVSITLFVGMLAIWAQLIPQF
jgi:hypothetical protein